MDKRKLAKAFEADQSLEAAKAYTKDLSDTAIRDKLNLMCALEFVSITRTALREICDPDTPPDRLRAVAQSALIKAGPICDIVSTGNLHR